MTGQFCAQCARQVAPGDRFCEWCGAWVAAPRRDHVEADVGVAAGVTDRGRRHLRNEDALALRDTGTALLGGAAVAVICDGVSSSARPDEASEAAAEAAADVLATALQARCVPATATRHAVHAAARAVTDLAAAGSDAGVAGRRAPACTFVSVVVTGDAVTVGWVGDSRAYWIPLPRPAAADISARHRMGPAGCADPAAAVPVRLTRDDSWLAQVLATGALAPALAAVDRRAHAITAWLGGGCTEVEPHVVTVEPDGPGVVVVCTDGLWNYVDSADELAAAVPPQAFSAPLDAARELVEIALRSGGRDNVTVAVLPVDGRVARPERGRHDQPA